MGPLLDAAVLVLLVVAFGSLGLLAWTIGVSGVAATRRGTDRLARRRAALTARREELPAKAASLRDAVARLAQSTRTGDR
ncbi:MAG: hypothetical protein DLM71_10475 [Chloroflexi bacterium]|nr:MAG: hypothetical protein DLM71_10475 [Chloroflexota bacterium]